MAADIGVARRSAEAPDLRAAIAARLGEIRRAAGMTQVSVCEQLRKPKSWIGKLETGRRSLLFSEAMALARLYGVELTALLPADEERRA